ncbi:MAG: radical SAM protein [Acidobacteriota bacterium]
MFEGSSVDQQQLDEIKARYGIGGRASGPSRFPIVLIKPSQYDADGYVIQWYRSAAPSNALALMHGLVEDCRQRKVLGEHVKVEIRSIDEDNTRVRTQQLARELKNGQGLVILVDVQSNQFPRAMDLALPLRVAGVQVCMGGFHVSGSMALQGAVTTELQEAMNLGISLFAGEVEEGRLDQVLHDAWRGELRPLYNYLGDPRPEDGADLPVKAIRATIGQYSSVQAATGGPLQCSFRTIVQAAGRKTQRRTVVEVEQILREHVQSGVGRFLIADDDFSENPEWEAILDRVAAIREQDAPHLQVTIQVDTNAHRLPGFVEKAVRAGVHRVFIAVESLRAQGLLRAKQNETRIGEYRKMLLAWKRAGVAVFSGYVAGIPAETVDGGGSDPCLMQAETAIDLLEVHCLRTLQRPDDPSMPAQAEASHPDPDPQQREPALKAEEWHRLYRDEWKDFYAPEHMEAVLQRAVALGMPLEKTTSLLLWFHFCIVCEGIDPLRGGCVRRKYRADRRPALPREGWLRFWSRYGSDLASKHWKLLRLYLRLRAIVLRLGQGDGSPPPTDAGNSAHPLDLMLLSIAIAR